MINLNDGSAAKLVKLRTNDGIDGEICLRNSVKVICVNTAKTLVYR